MSFTDSVRALVHDSTAVWGFVTAAAFIHPEGRYLGILIGTLCVAALGLVDDIWNVHPAVKMLALVGFALIPVVGYDVTLRQFNLPLLGYHHLGSAAAYPL